MADCKIKAYVLASGSSGNSLLISSGNTNILIDAGIAMRDIKQRLELQGYDISSLNGVVLTHEHTDHLRSLHPIARKYNVPLFITKKTAQKIGIDNNHNHLAVSHITSNSSFTIGDINIGVFSTFHDAVDPIGLTFTNKSRKISLLTDTGCYSSQIIENIKDSDCLLLEANYDEDMLNKGSYPYFLKQRIASAIGHLSNNDSARLVTDFCTKQLKQLMLLHLSENNNCPDIALDTVSSRIAETHKNTEISVANRKSPTDIIEMN